VPSHRRNLCARRTRPSTLFPGTAPLGTSGALQQRVYAQADQDELSSDCDDALTRALALARSLEAMLDAVGESLPPVERQEIRIAEAIAGTLGDRLASLHDRHGTAASRSDS
jgi:hypothetical protein